MAARLFASAALGMSAAVLALASAALGAAGPEWYPASVENWANHVKNADKVCQEGYQQSPVDLPGCNGTTPTRPLINITWATQPVTLTNNGHTVQITPTGSSKGKMFTDIAGTIKTYTLAQCHFHWGSEHVIDDVQQVMELHCVHTEDDAPGDAPKYGVLGIFYELGAPSAFLSQFEDELPTSETALAGRLLSEKQQPEHDLLGNSVDRKSWRRLAAQVNTSSYTGPTNFLQAITGIDRTHYWNYDGSFTTPPCTEIVDWYNLMGKATLSSAQLAKFKYAQGWSAAKGNFRSAQPLHGRTIYGCTALPQPKVINPWYPYNADHWAASTNNANRVCKHGTFQSPIDFERCAVPTPREPIGITWPTQSVALTNNGHTVQITAGNTGAARGKMKFGKKEYTLIQCHWHWGSEHRVGGLQLPLEVHCVHQLDGTEEAPSYGVFGVFYELSDKPNRFLSRFEDHLPSAPSGRRLDEAEEEVQGLNLFGDAITYGTKGRRLASSIKSSYTGPLDMQLLFTGVDRSKFWDYEGSFTTPPCTEAVDFYIMMGKAGVTKAQFDKFKAAMGWDTSVANGNFRPPQPLNGRAVSGCNSVDLPQTFPAPPVAEEESCPSQVPLITLQAITTVCVVFIFLTLAFLGSKSLIGPKGPDPQVDNDKSSWGRMISPSWGRLISNQSDQSAQVYGKSGEDDVSSIGGQKDGVEASLAKLQEDLKALRSSHLSILQAKTEENGSLVNNTLELAKEAKDSVKELRASKPKESAARTASPPVNVETPPVSNSIEVDAHDARLASSSGGPAL